MTLEMVRLIYRYDGWATERLLETAAPLTPEQWDASGGAGRRALRDGFVHLFTTQKSWRSWWDGSLPVEQAIRLTLDPADYPDLDALRALFAEQRAALDAFLAGLSEADVLRPFDAYTPNGVVPTPLWQMLVHLANHGTQHRSEIAVLLSDLGHSPGSLDMLNIIWN